MAYENIKQLEHYRTLRSFKAKFDPTWKMAYVAYSTTLDLIYLPVALQKVIQP